MTKYVILFRAINVGGNNKLPMKELVPLLENIGFEEVQYYIQTGNVILQSEEDPTTAIQTIVTQHFNFTPNIITLTASAFLRAQEQCPYQGNDGKLVHFYFCQHTANLAFTKIEKYLADSEQYSLIDDVLYLHAPEGIGRSKFVTNIESCLGTPATGRNLNTINKIYTMLSNEN